MDLGWGKEGKKGEDVAFGEGGGDLKDLGKRLLWQRMIATLRLRTQDFLELLHACVPYVLLTML